MSHDKHAITLPPGWVWTRRGFYPAGAVGAVLYAARATRWDESIPEIVDTSEAGVIRYAKECDFTEGQ